MAKILFLKALSAGERWITIKAPGHDKGQPVLVKPASDGSYKVIGGAGGALNHLRLTGVKSEASYKEEAKQRHSSRQDERKRQRERDQKDGLTEFKGKAKEAIKAQVGDEQAKFVKTVADALGWTEKDMRFPEEIIPERLGCGAADGGGEARAGTVPARQAGG